MGSRASKVTSAEAAVRRFVAPGAVLGLGGQNINRCPMALAHEIIRQGHGDLTVVGCNLSLPLDLMVAADLVRQTEQGSGNLERYGTLFTWRRSAENGDVAVYDYSHLTMASRFLAGSLGLPHIPTKSLLGTDILDRLVEADRARVVEDPWTAERVVLLPGLTPDISLIHATRADEAGNVVIGGVTSHEVDMVKASHTTIVTAEEVVPAGAFSDAAEGVTISGAYVDAVVHQPFGAFPTSVYRLYDYYEPDIEEYQARSREGVEGAREYLDRWVLGVATFDEYLGSRDPDGRIRRSLEHHMKGLA